jgi:predicted DNA-binding transcriptional regulator AlpA
MAIRQPEPIYDISHITGIGPSAFPEVVQDTAPARPSKTMPVNEVASALGVSERTVWRRASTGEIPKPIKIGQRRVWRVADIDRFIDGPKSVR